MFHLNERWIKAGEGVGFLAAEFQGINLTQSVFSTPSGYAYTTPGVVTIKLKHQSLNIESFNPKLLVKEIYQQLNQHLEFLEE